MLQLTHDAATLLTEIKKSSDVPDDFGLRIYPENAEAGEVTIGLGFTDKPQAGDVVSEQEGMRLFVAPELSQPLDNAAIDVTKADGSDRLVFRPQDEADPSTIESA